MVGTSLDHAGEALHKKVFFKKVGTGGPAMV
jgi:hypothetical protein